MLTITHTFTANDFNLIGENLSQRMTATITAGARWPFRLAQMVMGAVFVIVSIELFRSSTTDAVGCLLLGVFVICSAVVSRVVAWFLLVRVRRMFKRRVGSTVKWEMDEEGITFVSERFQWASFRSYTVTKAGVVLDGMNQIWIPESALSDTSVQTKVYEILDRHLKRVA